MEMSQHWKNKRVLVTGADGFVGSHLTDKLVALGAKVSVLVRGNSVNGTSRNTFKNLLPETQAKLDKIICCDIASPDATNLVVDANPDVILHLAAIAYVPFSFQHPLEVNEANVTGTLNMLEAARRLKNLERIVCTSSSEVYGTALTQQITEEHPLNPTSPYAASKVGADRYCYSYYLTYKIPVAVIRPFNMFGPRHTYDVIPKFITLALQNKPITVYGSGEQTRDFTYVSDAVDAFLTMGAEPAAIGKTINFGTGVDYSVNFIAQKVKELTGSKSEIVHVDARAAEVGRLCCDYSMAKKLFAWEPKVSIEEGIRKNIEWSKEFEFKMTNNK